MQRVKELQGQPNKKMDRRGALRPLLLWGDLNARVKGKLWVYPPIFQGVGGQ